MKKVLALALSCTMAACGVVGCGGKTVEIESASETTEKKEVSATVAGTGAENTGKIDLSKFEDEDIGVCLVINTNLGDKSICDLSYAGLAKKLPLIMALEQNVSSLQVMQQSRFDLY